MDRIQNIDYCINYLIKQNQAKAENPASLQDKQRLLRILMNIWQPQPLDIDFIQAQDAELQAQLADKGIVKTRNRLWHGDITRLKVDAIVNAANSRGLGCWQPMHLCIDNAIHSAAGLQLRQECNQILQGEEIATGGAIITPAYNLPAKYVIHTVGPIIKTDKPTAGQEELLAACYRSCLCLAREHDCHSIAFPCIATGEFHFPNQRAAEIAIRTCCHAPIRVTFVTFTNTDRKIYRQLVVSGQ